MYNATSWKPLILDENQFVIPNEALLQKILDDDVPLVAFRDALPPQMLTRALQAIGKAEAASIAYANAQLTTIGPYLASRLSRLDSYFAEASVTDKILNTHGRDPRGYTRLLVARCLGLIALQPLLEPSVGTYAPAVVRLHADGIGNPLHNDNIARDAHGMSIEAAQMRVQFTCVVCLQECDDGGELLLFRRRWMPSDEQFKIQQGLGYREDVVAGAQSLSFRPQVGDIYIFDPRNYHAIRPVRGRTRITLGFFFGLKSPGDRIAFAWA